MHSKTLINLLEKCLSESGEYIDMQKLCSALRVKIVEGALSDPMLYSRLEFIDGEADDVDDTRFVVTIRPNTTIREKNTLLALILAKLILNPDKVKESGADIDTFEYKGLKEMRYSRHMYLATRLALPEDEIDKIDRNALNKPVTQALEHYSEELIYSAISGHSVAVLLG